MEISKNLVAKLKELISQSIISQDELTKFSRFALSPVIPKVGGFGNISTVNLDNIIDNNPIFDIFSQISDVIAPITNIVETLGPIYDIAELILGGWVNLLISSLQEALSEFQSIVYEILVVPAFSDMMNYLKELFNTIDFSIIDSFFDENAITTLINQIDETDDNATILEKIQNTTMSTDMRSSLLDSFVQIILELFNKFFDNTKWLEIMLLPMIIPSVEISKLFNINIVAFSTSQQSNISILSNKTPSDRIINGFTTLPVGRDKWQFWIGIIIDYMLSYLEFIGNFIDTGGDDIAAYRKYRKYERPDLLETANKDVLTNVALIKINWVKAILGVSSSLISNGINILKYKLSDVLDLASNFIDLIKSYIEFYMNLFMYRDMIYTYDRHTGEVVTVLDELNYNQLVHPVIRYKSLSDDKFTKRLKPVMKNIVESESVYAAKKVEKFKRSMKKLEDFVINLQKTLTKSIESRIFEYQFEKYKIKYYIASLLRKKIKDRSIFKFVLDNVQHMLGRFHISVQMLDYGMKVYDFLDSLGDHFSIENNEGAKQLQLWLSALFDLFQIEITGVGMHYPKLNWIEFIVDLVIIIVETIITFNFGVNYILPFIAIAIATFVIFFELLQMYLMMTLLTNVYFLAKSFDDLNYHEHITFDKNDKGYLLYAEMKIAIVAIGATLACIVTGVVSGLRSNKLGRLILFLLFEYHSSTKIKATGWGYFDFDNDAYNDEHNYTKKDRVYIAINATSINEVWSIDSHSTIDIIQTIIIELKYSQLTMSIFILGFETIRALKSILAA